MAQEEPAKGGGEGANGGLGRSIYLSASWRDSSFDDSAYNPLYKVEVAAGSSSKKKLPRICYLDTNGGGKTFISLPSGRIIGVGGRRKSGSTIIIDTKTTTKAIRGPDLLSAKWCPVVVAVGSKVYALCTSPSYKEKPDFPPWFEVLDLSKGNVTETADGSLSMDGCSWEALPWPGFLPHKLPRGGYARPPIVSIRSSVVVFPYILISLNQRDSCTYAYDTSSGEWHKVDVMSFSALPFLGPAVPHGQSGCVFLGSSLENESVNAYRLHVSTSSSCKGAAALKLSVTVLFSLEPRAATVAEQHITSLDSGHFCLLSLWIDRRKRSWGNYSDTSEYFSGIYSRKLIAKLTTYQIDNPALLDQTEDQEILVSTLWDQDFKISSRYGFSSPSIFFALSV